MKRHHFLEHIQFHFRVNPIVALLGPRQCGKTTLAKDFASQCDEPVTFFDLEDSLDLERLKNPTLTLSSLKGLIIIDEIQRHPDLFPVLRVLIDKNRLTQKYLILGSASRELIRQSLETLAGRISYLELTPFDMSEVQDRDRLWLRGGFPLSYLSETDETSFSWREAYIRTFLEQDIPNLGFSISANALRKFWVMLAHYHGKIFNANELGKSLGITHNTARKYLDILTGTFMVRELRPWYANVKKRQVKSPKIYFRDSGVYHALLRITDKNNLSSVPQLGSSWEGYALEEVIRSHMPTIDQQDCYFWSTQAGAELDLLIVSGNMKVGYEFKYQDVPKVSKSMHIAMGDLELDRLCIIYPGNRNFQVDEKIFLTNLSHISEYKIL